MMLLCLGVTLLVWADQLTKVAIRATLAPSQSRAIIPGVLHLTYVQNTGAAFGLFRGHPGIFVCFSIVIAIWLIVELLKSPRHAWPMTLSLMLILSGAVGNLLDRWRFGYVVDFIDVRVWPVFNLADSMITCGVAFLLLMQTGWLRRRTRSTTSS